MSIHRAHPVGDDPRDAVLYDDCDRCTEHSVNLTSLDTSHLHRLGVLIETRDYRTYTERNAADRLETWARVVRAAGL